MTAAKGSFDGPQRASTIDANDQLKDASEYAKLVIAFRNGAPIRIQDVAAVFHDADHIRLAAWVAFDRDGKRIQQPGILINVQRQPGANVIETVKGRGTTHKKSPRDAGRSPERPDKTGGVSRGGLKGAHLKTIRSMRMSY